MNELYHYNHNHDRLGRFARTIGGASRSTGSSILSIGKKKKVQPPQADIKKGKAANTKLSDEDRNRLVKTGTKEEITANKDRLSNKELESALNRLESEKNIRSSLEQRLSKLNGEDAEAVAEAGKEKVNSLIEKAGKLEEYADVGMKAWNVAAKLHNATAAEDDKWPTFNQKTGEPQANGPTMDAYDLMTKGSASDILKNKDKLTKDQLKEAIARKSYYETLEKYAAKESAQKEASDREKMINKERDKDSRSATYIRDHAGEMSKDELDRAIANYEYTQSKIRDRKATEDKINQYAKEEERSRMNVDSYVNNLDEGYTMGDLDAVKAWEKQKEREEKKKKYWWK